MVNGQVFSFRSLQRGPSLDLVCTQLLIPSLPSGFLGYPRRRLSAPGRFRSDPGLFLSSPHQYPAPCGSLLGSVPAVPGPHRRTEDVLLGVAPPPEYPHGARWRSAAVRSPLDIANRQRLRPPRASPPLTYDFRPAQSSPRLRAMRTRFLESA